METMTDTPRTNEALAALLDRDGDLSEENAPEVLVKLCRAMERERDELLAGMQIIAREGGDVGHIASQFLPENA